MDEKTFTQEEVNVIVKDRLAKEKAKYDKQLADVQAGCKGETERERTPSGACGTGAAG